jgi:hypothetical protein
MEQKLTHHARFSTSKRCEPSECRHGGGVQWCTANNKTKYFETTTRGSLCQTDAEPSASFTESGRHPSTIIITEKQNRFCVSTKHIFLLM